MLTFGPIPSRRLGFSLGINNIPMKHCSYACTYCQVGRTRPLEIQRHAFYTVEEIRTTVEKKLTQAQAKGQTIDYLSFVPDGEPTLDLNLGTAIDVLKPFGIPIAVICNATQINDPDVIKALTKADWVSLKVDSVLEPAWRKINRPYKKLKLPEILAGILAFSQQYGGKLVTETMLIRGINADIDHLMPLADFLSTVKPATAYLAIPIRPPAESHVEAPDPETCLAAIQIVAKKVPTVEALFDVETQPFISTGNLQEDILSITAVHPLRETPLRKMIIAAGGDWSLVNDLLQKKLLKQLYYRDETFYLHNH